MEGRDGKEEEAGGLLEGREGGQPRQRDNNLDRGGGISVMVNNTDLNIKWRKRSN